MHNNEWWFVVEDVVFALTDSVNPKDYINKMRTRDKELTRGMDKLSIPLRFQLGEENKK